MAKGILTKDVYENSLTTLLNKKLLQDSLNATKAANAAAENAQTAKSNADTAASNANTAAAAANEAVEKANAAIADVEAALPDPESGIIAYFALGRQKNLELGFKTPLWATSQACTVEKTGDNVNFADLVPASDTDPGVDEYSDFECMNTFDVNASIDSDGHKRITAVKGDTKFDDLETDVLVCGCSYYEKTWTDDNYFYYSRVFSPKEGYTAPPHCRDIDGNVMPYFLIHKYVGSGTSSTELKSVKGQAPARSFISYNYGASTFKSKKPNGKYYSLFTTSEQAWVALTMLLTGTTKNIQSRWYGCFNYYFYKNCSVALTNIAGVVVPKNSGFALYSSVSVGRLPDGATSADRSKSSIHSLADSATIKSIASYDDANDLLTLDCDPFDSDTDCVVSTMPWRSGFSDLVKGRTGCPGSTFTNGKLPVVFMGVELFVGGYETIGNAFYDIEAAATRTIYYTNDSTKITSTVATAKETYQKGGTLVSNGTGWKYVCDIDYDPASGVMYQKSCGLSGSGGSSGYADAVYFDSSESGQREILAWSIVGFGSYGGPFAASAYCGLSGGAWSLLGRPSFSACTSG
jgi:hypothetical protein